MSNPSFHSITYVRPGHTRDKAGQIVPAGMRYTYNLLLDDALKTKYLSDDLDDAQKETLIPVLLQEGATYPDIETRIPGYVVHDETKKKSVHWQFFQANKPLLFVHVLDDAAFGSTYLPDREALTAEEASEIAAEMCGWQDGIYRLQMANHRLNHPCQGDWGQEYAL